MGDVYFPQTTLLLPFDGANGATTTSDLSNSNHAATFVGNAQISTAQSKFGGSSLYLDGTGDYLTIPTSTSFNLGSGDWTIECWIKTTDTSSVAILNQSNGSAASNSSWLIWLGGDGKPGIYLTENTGWDKYNINTTVVTDNVWHHVAGVRNGSSLRMYVDGVSSSSTDVSNFTVPDSSRVFDVGSQDGSSPYTGYIDQARFTQGVARYTSTFTPPTTAHLTSAGDVNKQIIINSTADGVAVGTGGINQARIAKAWVNFNGSGTVAIRDSYNVSSITDDGTGKYKVNFSTAMSNINYSAVVDGKYTESGDAVYNTVGFLRRIATATSYIGVRGIGGNASSSFDDLTTCNVIVFGN